MLIIMSLVIIRVLVEIRQSAFVREIILGVRNFVDVMSLAKCAFKDVLARDVGVRQEHAHATLPIENVILIFARRAKHICSHRKLKGRGFVKMFLYDMEIEK